MQNQPTLPGTRRAVSHSNLGKAFENEIVSVNYNYNFKKLAFVVQNEKTWMPCTHKFRRKMLDDHNPHVTALTDTGYPLFSQKSKPDFDGTLSGGRAACFDAKETRGKSLPLENIEGHQFKYLNDVCEMGGLSGFLIHLSDLGRIFFFPADAAYEIYKNSMTGGRKSISLAVMEDVGKEIFREKGFVEWISAAGKF